MRDRNLSLSLLILCLAALVGMAACGGGGSPTTCETCPAKPGLVGVTVYPGGNGTPVNVAAGGSVTFNAYGSQSNSSTIAPIDSNWTASGGTITGNGSPTGAFQAPTTTGTVTITVTDTANMNLGATITVNVTAAPANGLLVSPGATEVAAASVVQFSATQNGTAFTPAVWQVNGVGGGDSVHGTIDGSGNYTAPLTPPPTGSTTITACMDNACANTATASVTVVFSNASLSGSYVFAYAGEDLNGVMTAVGSFVADGSGGSTTSGEEDFVDEAAIATPGSFGGTYTIGPDGRGTFTISSNGPDSGGIIQFVLTSGPQGEPAQHGVLTRFDEGATGSGTLDAQNNIALGSISNGFSGYYVFGLSGIDIDALPLDIAGRFQSDGFAIPTSAGEQDINDSGTVAPADTTLQGGFTPDPDEATTGRGTVTFTTTNALFVDELGTSPNPAPTTFAYYAIDATHFKVIQIDDNMITSGDFFQESGGNGPFNASIVDTANYSFTSGGSSDVGAFAAGGVLQMGGPSSAGSSSGTISGGIYDNNNGGTVLSGLTIGSGSYGTDGYGRITFTFSPGGTALSYFGYPGTYNGQNGPVSVIEMIDETGKTSQDVANYVDAGLAYEQTAADTPSGSFGLNMTGIANGQKNGGEQDIDGQFVIEANSSLTGNLDINNIANGYVPTPNVYLANSSITTVSTDGRGTPLTLVSASPVTSFPLTYYVIDDNTTLVLETDNKRVLTGIILKQY